MEKLQRVFVDFGRGSGKEISLLLTSRFNAGVTVTKGEHIILYDDSLEVEGVVHQGTNALGRTYWYALPDWSTQKDLDNTPLLSEIAHQE